MSTPADDPIGQEHAALRRAVPQKRRMAQEDRTVVGVGKAAFAIMDKMREAGQSFEERCEYLIGVLKQILRFGREWKYLCNQCDDYGLVIADCAGDRTCGRYKPHLPHVFGTPCACSRGRAFEFKQPVDDYTQAGKTSKPKPRSFQRMGS